MQPPPTMNESQLARDFLFHSQSQPWVSILSHLPHSSTATSDYAKYFIANFQATDTMNSRLTFEDIDILTQHAILLSVSDCGTLVGVSRAFLASGPTSHNFFLTTHSNSNTSSSHEFLPVWEARAFNEPMTDSHQIILPTTMSSTTALKYLGFEPSIAQHLSNHFERGIETWTLPQYLKLFIDGMDSREELTAMEALRLIGAGADVLEDFQRRFGGGFCASIGNGARRWFWMVITQRYRDMERNIRRCKERATALHEMYRNAEQQVKEEEVRSRGERVDSATGSDSASLVEKPDASDIQQEEEEEEEVRTKEKTVDSAIDLMNYNSDDGK